LKRIEAETNAQIRQKITRFRQLSYESGNRLVQAARKLSFEAGRIHTTTMLARIQAGWSETKPNPSTHART
jgi:hypothetical protein